MKKNSFYLGILCLLFAQNTVKAQEKNSIEQLNEVVVTATKFAIRKEQVGKLVYQISPEEINNFKGQTIVDVLNTIAGIEINGTNSAAGKNKSMYVRGGRNRQVLVLIDGVPVSDPSGVTTTYDLRLLTLSQVESIEVMKGASSTLYGSGAATAVINIKLKKSSKKSISVNYQVSLGTNNSEDNSDINLNDANQNIALTGTVNKFNYLASFNATNTNGLSEASDKDSSVKFESDKFTATNSFIRFGYEFSHKLNVQLFSNFDKNKYDYDAGAFADSDINNGENEQLRFGVSSNFIYAKGSLALVASYNKIDRTFDSFNSWTNTVDGYKYKGVTYDVDLVNNYKLSDQIQFITGINYQQQKNNTNTPYGNISDAIAKYDIVDPYVSVVYNTSFGFNITAGTRLNNHSEYGNHWVYNINPSYNFSDNFRIISSYSTAFIAPSAYQLFSQYGNVDLEPEENNTVEAGFVFSQDKQFEINSVFFYREEDNAIILPDYVTYVNSEETLNAKGVETEVQIDILKDFTFRLGHTYTHKSSDLDYIPKNKFTALLETNSIKNTYLSLLFKNISKRTYFDQWGTGSTINLDAYNLVDFNANHTLIKDKLTVFVNVTNIFNEDYVETIGYTTKGRNFKVGLDFTF
ncbi:TonB-dependent siderophore receptor [Lutibacter sp. B1]|uniref:TonB-dependent receptor plug domain-containing protein n=1 Tax=Lutibacter sp. B1 TaxID=2725996 RepID=UPI001456F2C1|nr:TonB-dependent receptor [Lutibacter sp. B1]NLP58744.1 TonB-dependent receptor [Lutibacter sp. B1]